MTDEVRVVPAEALVVGPDEVLIVKLDLEGWDGDDVERIARDVREVLVQAGLAHRSVVVTGREIELAKVTREGASDQSA